MFEDVSEAAGAVPTPIIPPEIERPPEYPSGLKSRLERLLRAVWQQRLVIALASGNLTFAILLSLFVFTVFLPQSLHYAFADQKNCVASPAFFPGLASQPKPEVFTLTRVPTISIAHKPIFSYSLCAAPSSNPLANATYIDRQQTSFAGLRVTKSIKVITSAYPAVHANSFTAKNVPTGMSLKFTVRPADATFDYALTVGRQTSPCSQQKTSLNCSLAPLKLAYSSQYDVKLVRVFHNHVASSVTSSSLQTISATAISQTSISPGSVVYDTPQQLTLQTDKPLTALDHIALTTKNPDGTTADVPVTYSFSGHTITVNITSPLARKTRFDLHIDNLTANDTSRLEQPYDLSFTTSGGPKVSGDNIPSYGLASGQTMAVSFDQVLNPAQDPAQFASLLVNGAKQPAAISLNGQQIIIKLANSYPVCASVTVQLSAAAQNAYGVSGDSAWSYTSRSHCYTTYSIGTSVKGRPITAYQFGSGPSMVLYVAAMEGNEQNSAELLQQWIPDIDANPGKIPSYRTIVVIPQINPDGFAANTRVNADGIDLNRNFPANNWQTQVTEPLANTVWTNDGGPQPLSEPESQALANFYEAHHPRLTLTMHSHGAIVEANDAGDSVALGAQYASLADYRAVPTYAIGSFFDYTTTGAFEDWANDKLGLPVLEVELESPTAVEYTRNLPALWSMAQASP